MPFQAEDVLRTLAGRIRTASVQIGYWLQVLWALDLLDGFDNAVAQLGRTEAMAALLEDQLPKRARGSRRSPPAGAKGSTP